MAIDFPASPSTNDTFTAGSIVYKWDGDKWIGLGITPADRLVEGSNKLEIDSNNNLVYSGGNFAVGTSTANNTLTLYGDSSSSLRISKSGVLAYDHTFDGSTYTIANNNGSSGIDIVFGTKTAGGESLRIDPSGRLLVNTTTSRIVQDHVGNGPQGLIQIEATNSAAIMSIISAGTADVNRCGTINLGRHRNSTVGDTPTIVNNSDALGAVVFSGGDGTDMRCIGAKIHAEVDGSPGEDDMPGALVFSTTPDGSSSPYLKEKLRITSDGQVKATGPGSGGSVISSKVTTNNGGYLAYEALNSSGTSVFSVTHNGVLTATGGIDFSSYANATGMTSEVLDDYEEGTFEPTFRADSGDFTTVVYHPDTGGRYVKIGNYVWVTGCVRIAGATITIGSPNNGDTLCVGNLPFNNNARTNGDNADSHGVCRVPVWNGSQAPHFIQARQNVNFCNLYYMASLTGTSVTNIVSHLTNQSMVQFTFAYTSD